MLTLNIIISNLVLSLQVLVLLAVIYFLSYVYKNGLNKWYKYASILLTLFMSGLLICSLVAYTCHGICYSGKRCGKGTNVCYTGYDGCHMQKSCVKSKCKMKNGQMMEHGGHEMGIHHEDDHCKPGCTKPCCANKNIEKEKTMEVEEEEDDDDETSNE